MDPSCEGSGTCFFGWTTGFTDIGGTVHSRGELISAFGREHARLAFVDRRYDGGADCLGAAFDTLRAGVGGALSTASDHGRICSIETDGVAQQPVGTAVTSPPGGQLR